MHGSIAQLGERLGHNQKVVGSSPAASIALRAMKPLKILGFMVFSYYSRIVFEIMLI